MEFVDAAGLNQGFTFLWSSPNPVDHEAQAIDRDIFGPPQWSGIQSQLGLFHSDIYLAVWANKQTPPCPWDCGDGDGTVGIVDFLKLLADWAVVGSPCDFDGGGVGIVDFLKLLANWGNCPP